MQLKRDTDYALRLLLCISKQASDNGNGITILELSKYTSVAPTIAVRICKKLRDAKLIKEGNANGSITSYILCKGALNKTVFDIIRVVEGNSNLFAVFDRTTELYFSAKDYFDDTELLLTNALKRMTIRDLKEKANQRKN